MTDTETLDIEKTAIGVLDPDMTQVDMQPQAETTQYAANVDCPVCHTPNPPSETYCIDCGFLLNAQPVEVATAEEAPSAGTLVSSDGTREFSLRVGENTVGRESADILLTHNSVSRKHAKFVVESGRVFVEDMDSANGTSVDGVKAEAGQQVELKDGCEVMFGSAALKYKAAEGAIETPVETDYAKVEAVVPEAVAETSESTVEPAAAGKLVAKDGSLSFALVEGVNTIGRRQGDNMIAVPDPYCSSKHAELLVENGVFTLTDIGSTNGSMVNGVKLEANAPRIVTPADEITLGETVFMIEVALRGQ